MYKFFVGNVMGLDPAVFSLNTTDDDTQNISISGTASLNEGTSGTINVSLTNEPSSDVTVSLSSSVPGALSLGTASLTFTSSNYNIPQAVAVNALSDANTLSETVTVTASASGIASKTWNILTVEYPSGTITGLTGPLVLINNGTDSITVSADGSFTFNTPSVTYNVIAKTYSSNQICPVSGGAGNNSVAPSSITVNCLGTYSDREYALGLVKTGQTAMYMDSDDGHSQKTLSRTYIDNGDGTVSDYVTGLTWQKCSKGTNNDASCSGSPPKFENWTTANSYCSSLNLGGRPINSWKLPTLKELSTILDLGKYAPSIDPAFFPNTGLNGYWTSTLYSNSVPPKYWQLSFAEGYSNMWSNNSLFYVRCVTDNITSLLPSPSRFTDNANGTVKDNATRLIWQKCSRGQSGSGCSTGTVSYASWIGSANYCNTLSLASRTWRMPNRNELQSIADYSRCVSDNTSGIGCSQIDITNFPNTSDRYWSSTTDANNFSNAWTINFQTAGSFTNEIWVLNKSSASSGNATKIRCVSGP